MAVKAKMVVKDRNNETIWTEEFDEFALLSALRAMIAKIDKRIDDKSVVDLGTWGNVVIEVSRG